MTVGRTYPGSVVRVHDGDTIRVSADLGFGLSFAVDARLSGMNAQELKLPGGVEARDHLIGLLPVGSAVTLTVLSVDKFGGRLDCRVVTAAGVDVAQQMVADGWAASWNGKGTKPVPPFPPP